MGRLNPTLSGRSGQMNEGLEADVDLTLEAGSWGRRRDLPGLRRGVREVSVQVFFRFGGRVRDQVLAQRVVPDVCLLAQQMPQRVESCPVAGKPRPAEPASDFAPINCEKPTSGRALPWTRSVVGRAVPSKWLGHGRVSRPNWLRKSRIWRIHALVWSQWWSTGDPLRLWILMEYWG